MNVGDSETYLTEDSATFHRLRTKNRRLSRDLAVQIKANCKLRQEVTRLRRHVRQLQADHKISTAATTFSVHTVNSSHIRKLFEYYTGFSFSTFLVIFSLLVSTGNLPFTYLGRCKPTAFSHISLQDQLLFVLMKLRNNFHFKDLGFRFGLSPQKSSVLFKSWINYMFFTFSSLSLWPPRDVIISKMPSKFNSLFPTTLAIIDSTEIKMQRPSSLKIQSQCWSEYKSSPTLKGLVAVDPRGSVVFISPLFSGSVSDNEITSHGGFLSMVEELLRIGHIEVGDSIMCDKGFTAIDKELSKFGIIVSRPPFVKCGQAQMSGSDVSLTRKIASERVIVERSIGRIKNFKILSGRLDISFLTSVNQIWFVCASLTNFMPSLVSD